MPAYSNHGYLSGLETAMKSALGGRFVEIFLIVAVVLVTGDRAGGCVADILLDFFDVDHGWGAEDGQRKKCRAAEALCKEQEA